MRPARRVPEQPDLARTLATRELDHVLAAVFGLWDYVIPEDRLFSKSPQLALAMRGLRKTEMRQPEPRKAAEGND